MHYEGLDFPTDFPCRIELKDDTFFIKRIKPEVTVTLPLSQIKSFSAMEEENFMLRYHGQAVTTSKAKGIQKYYLVVDYISKENEEKRLAFWGQLLNMENSLNYSTILQTAKRIIHCNGHLYL